MKASIVEMFRWSGSAKLRGLALKTDEGVLLPGMITVDLDKIDVQKAVDHYFSSYVVFTKAGEAPHVPHDVLVLNENGSSTTFGPWADVDRAEVEKAISEALV